MKKSRFREQQIAYILRQAEEGTSVEEVCHKAAISEATLNIAIPDGSAREKRSLKAKGRLAMQPAWSA